MMTRRPQKHRLCERAITVNLLAVMICTLAQQATADSPPQTDADSLQPIPYNEASSAKAKLICTEKSFAQDRVPLKSFRIPPGWEQTKRYSGWAFGGNTGYCYEFAPKGKAQEGGLYIDWDGNIFIDYGYQLAWRELLKAPPHELNQADLVVMDRMVRLNQADPEYFKLSAAKLMDWNGRKVVWTEGQTLPTNNSTDPIYHSFAITYDNHGDWKSAGTIRFSGTKEVFDQHKAEAEKTMRELRWSSMNKPHL